MGLIKSAVSAVGSTLHDQWKDVISCENMTNDVLMVKKTTDTGIISNKSAIIVAPGQCAIIYNNGKVIDATAEEGIYTFDSSTEPSFFAGQFGAVFKEMWQRFTYGGGAAQQQAVFFFNIKEIMDNKFGTKEPIIFQDWSHAIPNQMTGAVMPMMVSIRCFGTYTFKIANPALFMEKIAGTAEVYKKEQLQEQMRTEIMAVFQNVTNELGGENYKVPVLQMPSQTDEIRVMMDQKVFDEKIRERGVEIVCFAVESVSLDKESEEKIQRYELSSNAYMQQGRMVDAYSNAMEDAAKNTSGAANGFMGIGMVNMMSGGMGNGVTSGPWNANTANSSVNNSNQPNNQSMQEPKNEGWKCSCGSVNDVNAKFCSACGKAKDSKKVCPKCNAENGAEAKFCASCGEKL